MTARPSQTSRLPNEFTPVNRQYCTTPIIEQTSLDVDGRFRGNDRFVEQMAHASQTRAGDNSDITDNSTPNIEQMSRSASVISARSSSNDAHKMTASSTEELQQESITQKDYESCFTELDVFRPGLNHHFGELLDPKACCSEPESETANLETKSSSASSKNGKIPTSDCLISPGLREENPQYRKIDAESEPQVGHCRRPQTQQVQ